MKYKLILSFLFFIAFFCSKPAFSHPHGWFETYVNFLIANNKITEIQVKWKHDEFTSMSIIEVFDENKDGKLAGNELISGKNQIVKTIKRSDFFSFIYVNGAKININEINNAKLELDKDIVSFSFAITLPNPVDPAKKKLAASFYDPNYFYDIYFAEKNPVKFINGTTKQCSYKIEDDLKTKIYFNMANPQIVRIFCKGK